MVDYERWTLETRHPYNTATLSGLTYIKENLLFEITLILISTDLSDFSKIIYCLSCIQLMHNTTRILMASESSDLHSRKTYISIRARYGVIFGRRAVILAMLGRLRHRMRCLATSIWTVGNLADLTRALLTRHPHAWSTHLTLPNYRFIWTRSRNPLILYMDAFVETLTESSLYQKMKSLDLLIYSSQKMYLYVKVHQSQLLVLHMSKPSKFDFRVVITDFLLMM